MKVELVTPNPDIEAAWDWIRENQAYLFANYRDKYVQVANDPRNPIKGHGETREDSRAMIEQEVLRVTPLICYKVPGEPLHGFIATI